MYAAASSVGGLEGLRPSKNFPFQSLSAASPPTRIEKRSAWGGFASPNPSTTYVGHMRKKRAMNTNRKRALAMAAGAGAVLALRALGRRTSYDFRGKSVLI